MSTRGDAFKNMETINKKLPDLPVTWGCLVAAIFCLTLAVLSLKENR